MAFVNLGYVNAADPWWDSDWTYRKSITIDSSLVDADLTDFPVMISVSDADLASKAQADGDDIAFADISGTKLDHEIEYYNSTTGTLVSWVRIPSVSSSTDTVFYIYYGNSLATNQENPTGVWTSDYTLVLHLDETTGNHTDSTSYASDAEPLGGVNQSAVGKIDGADFFDGVNDVVQVEHREGLAEFNVSFTVSCWFYLESNSTTKTLLNKYNTTGADRAWYVQYRPFATVQIALVGSEDGTTTQQWWTAYTPANKTWYHLAVVWQADTAPTFYINGAQSATSGIGTISNIHNNTATPLYIGDNYASDEFHGILDEVRITNGTRSADWISASYRNQDSPQTFYSVGSEETGDVFYVTASAGAGGSISPSGEVAVQQGDNKTFYIMPDDGYHITDVEVDTISVGAVYAYKFVSVASNHTIVATFAVTTPPTIGKDKSQYDRGETVTITISGGTANKPVMLQIQNPTGTKKLADQGNFASDGTYVYQFKVPNWVYGVHTIHVRDTASTPTATTCG
jgi:hypothetical protein